MKTTPPTKPKSINRKFIIVTCAIIVVLAGIFLAFDLPARQRFAVVNDEVERIRQDVMEPAGAVERTESAHSRGNGILPTVACWPNHCPALSRVWSAPIEPGKESEFLAAAFQTLGYKGELPTVSACEKLDAASTCSAFGTRDKFRLNINVSAPENATWPSRDVLPKHWRWVSINMDYYWDVK